LWISNDTRNASAVFNSLKDFGAPLVDMTEADFAEEGYFYQMGVPPVRVDILMGISGVEFEEAWDRRKEVDFDGLTVPFISKEDLITTKRASGRPQDLIDVDVLSQSD
jgi:predicted nucleotidyltransferase